MPKIKKNTASKIARAVSGSGSSVIRWRDTTIHGIRVKVAENFPDPITRWKRDAETKKQKAS
jgi:hypothetical protein